MFHLLVFVVFIWPILFLPLIFICGKASETKTVKKEQKSDGGVKSQVKPMEKQDNSDENLVEFMNHWENKEEENKRWDKEKLKMVEEPIETYEEKYKKEQKLLKERDDPEESKEIYEFLNDKKKLEDAIKNGICGSSFSEDTINTCAYRKHFTRCDLDDRMGDAYANMIITALEIAETGTVVEIGRWMYAQIKLGEATLPFFEKVLNEYYEVHHKQHSFPEVQERLKNTYQQILDHHKMILTAYEEYKKKGTEVYVRSKDSYHVRKEWVKPFPGLYWSYLERTKDLTIQQVLDNCQNKYGYGGCDFLERINYYIHQERKAALKTFSSKSEFYKEYGLFLYSVPVSDMREWLKLDSEAVKESLVLIKERLGKHKDHAKDPKKLDEMVEKHEKILTKIEEWDKKLEGKNDYEIMDAALIEKEIPVLGGKWNFKKGYH